jgi:hypothetical protein
VWPFRKPKEPASPGSLCPYTRRKCSGSTCAAFDDGCVMIESARLAGLVTAGLLAKKRGNGHG